jgi:hypothetical protein
MGWGPDNFRKSGKLTWLLRRYFRYLSGNPARGDVLCRSWPLQTGDPPQELTRHLLFDPPSSTLSHWHRAGKTARAGT